MSYDEYLISQAGGDGDDAPENLATVSMFITPRFGDEHTVQFTRVPMSRVKAAIDLLNDDTWTPGGGVSAATKLALNREYGKYADTPTTPLNPRTGDFTPGELFPPDTYKPNLSYGAYACKECAALVWNVWEHVAWHNKLLP